MSVLGLLSALYRTPAAATAPACGARPLTYWPGPPHQLSILLQKLNWEGGSAQEAKDKGS
jgi:hypothetical protein